MAPYEDDPWGEEPPDGDPGLSAQSRYGVALAENGMSEAEVAKALQLVTRYNRVLAEEVRHGVATDDVNYVIAIWAMTDGRRDAIGLPDTKKGLAEMLGISAGTISKKLSDGRFRAEYMHNRHALSVLDQYFDPALHNLGREVAYGWNVKSADRKLFFQLHGMLMADKDSENGVTRAPLNEGDVEGWSEQTAALLMQNARMKVFLEQIAGVVKAGEAEPGVDFGDLLKQGLQSALTSYMGGSLKPERSVEEAEFEEIDALPPALAAAARASERQGEMDV